MSFYQLPSHAGPELPYCRAREIHFAGSNNHYSVTEFTESAGSFPAEGVSYTAAMTEVVKMFRMFYAPGARLVLKTDVGRLVFERTGWRDRYALVLQCPGRADRWLARGLRHNLLLPLLRLEFCKLVSGADRFSIWMGGDNELVLQ